MKIGIDISLAECRTSGYGVIDFKIKNLFPNGRDSGLDKDAQVYFTRSNPKDWYENGRLKINATYCLNGADKGMYTSKHISWNEAWDLYLKDKDAIDDYADVKNCPFNEENPSERDLLILIDTVDSFSSIQ